MGSLLSASFFSEIAFKKFKFCPLCWMLKVIIKVQNKLVKSWKRNGIFYPRKLEKSSIQDNGT